MIQINNIDSYVPKKNEGFLIDTNVWIYLFCPLAGYKPYLIKPYENFFNTALKNGSVFFISSMILSEFINRFLRLEFNIANSKSVIVYKDFKRDFRPSPLYKATALAVQSILKQNILKIVKPIEDRFSSINIQKLIESIDLIEFNDEYISELSSLGQIKIITDDSDFSLSKSNSQIITANKKLLIK